MDQRTIQILFILLRSAICGTKLTEEERNNYSPDLLQELLKISSKHDVVHLLVLGLKQNDLIPKEKTDIEKCIFQAVYRYEQIRYEYDNLCDALENAQIPFLPLKGSVIRKYYPEAWMRTSCDIDILVHPEDLEKAIGYLADHLRYVKTDRSTHDVSLFSSQGVHIELHFDLAEEGQDDILQKVWNNVVLHEDNKFWYEMSDALFYFYHIAHMAKHVKTGGCGIKPFIDLCILEDIHSVDLSARNDLLAQGGLLRFANISRNLCAVWFKGKEADELTLQMQEFIINGGAYGSIDNRVAIQQKQQGGRLGYILSRIFVSYAKLKGYYPILEKHPWLMPIMQIRRWFMLLKPNVAKMAKGEIAANGNLDKSQAIVMNHFLDHIGLS